jgi:NAD(P)-dependent dehydrogenase (short-subunit alcohol dehydrogenase family)
MRDAFRRRGDEPWQTLSLDLSDEATIEAVTHYIADASGTLDALVSNVGTDVERCPDTRRHDVARHHKVHPTGQYSKQCPQVEGHVLRLSARYTKLRRSAYRKVAAQ